MVSISVFRFTRPRTVAPGEYFVSTNPFYARTTRNARWDPLPEAEQEHTNTHFEQPSSSISPCDAGKACTNNGTDDMPVQPPPSVRRGRDIPSSSALDQPPIATLSVESDSPESAAGGDLVTRRQRAHRKRSYRLQEPTIKNDSTRIKGAARRKRAKETRLQSTGPQTCKWNGCGESIPNGNQIWEHMKTAHGASRDGRRLRTTKQIKEEDEDMEIDELVDDYSSSSGAGETSRDGSHTGVQLASSWFDRVRCQWEGCRSEIQYIGLRRHIESKHIPVRGAHCPRGCGYQSNRADMLGRHVRRCQVLGRK